VLKGDLFNRVSSLFGINLSGSWKQGGTGIGGRPSGWEFFFFGTSMTESQNINLSMLEHSIRCRNEPTETVECEESNLFA